MNTWFHAVGGVALIVFAALNLHMYVVTQRWASLAGALALFVVGVLVLMQVTLEAQNTVVVVTR